MNANERLELIATLRNGHCKHATRVNICVDCLLVIEKIVADATKE